MNKKMSLDEQLEKKVEILVRRYIKKHRKELIQDYISENFSKYMAEDRLLTSEEVMNMLQISLGRRIKDRVLIPTNPEAQRNYRFIKSDVVSYIERNEVNDD